MNKDNKVIRLRDNSAIDEAQQILNRFLDKSDFKRASGGWYRALHLLISAAILVLLLFGN